MIIENENFIIRSAQADDAQVLTNWWNDGEVMAHAGFPNGLNTTVEKTLKQIESYKSNLSQLLIIEIGNMSVGECNYRIKDCTAEIGIKICDASYQNKGYGIVLLKMLINYLFTENTLNVEKIILDTNLKNTRAQHVYEKLGFTKVRINIDAWIDQLGEYQSSVAYEMTIEDFRKIK